MPTYEYECTHCGGGFEAFQRMSDPPLKTCEVCGAKGSVSRLVGAGAGLIFKGSGFYITDYKRRDTAGIKNGEGPKKSETEKKPSEKKDKTDKSESASSPSSSKSSS